MQSRLDRIGNWQRRARSAEYSVSKMAEDAGVTSRFLEMFFQERFRVAPHDWMLRERMTEALPLLMAGVCIKDVATKVGYKQVSHFSREFKRFFRLPPARYVLRQFRYPKGKNPRRNSHLDN